MNRVRYFYSSICTLLLVVGCANHTGQITKSNIDSQEQKDIVQLAIKYAVGDLTTYKVTTENQRQATWEGNVSNRPVGFIGGRTSNRIEITFNQLIQTVDDKGSAVAQITITELKYLATSRDNIVLDFDSARQKDMENPLGRLIGQNYVIEVTSTGQVSRIIDADSARAAISEIGQQASQLLSDSAIKKRHSINVPAAAGQKELQIGESWTSTESISFDLMGTRTYTKTYTLEDIEYRDDRKIGLFSMSATASEKQQIQLPFEFENVETYIGSLTLDLTFGKVEECREELQIEWLLADPDTQDTEQPNALRVNASQLYSIEKIE